MSKLATYVLSNLIVKTKKNHWTEPFEASCQRVATIAVNMHEVNDRRLKEQTDWGKELAIEVLQQLQKLGHCTSIKASARDHPCS